MVFLTRPSPVLNRSRVAATMTLAARLLHREARHVVSRRTKSFRLREAAETRCLCCAPALSRLFTRLAADRSRRPFRAAVAGGAPAGGAGRIFAYSRETLRESSSPIVFTDLRLFDGMSRGLRDDLRVIVEGGRISAVEPVSKPLAAPVQIFRCGGGVLMPGLIDAHYHVMLASLSLNELHDRRSGLY